MTAAHTTSAFRAFSYKTPTAFLADCERFSPDIPYNEACTPLAASLRLGARIVPNRLAVHPMEGADGGADGSPGELTVRRYQRFAAGGAGLLWFEAVAVVPEGRANPRQLWLHADNADAFARLLEATHEAAVQAGHARPYTVLQLTHSGRQSRPGAVPAPIIACENPLLDRQPGRVIADTELERLRDHYVAAARLGERLGFDAVDIKASHGYLLGELLGARLRVGKYGGAFANRTRLLLEIVDAVRAATGHVVLASRYGVFDGVAQPYGWGMDATGADEPHQLDLREPLELARQLHAHGMTLFDVTGGNPYYNPHLNRPFDRGIYTPPEHPMIGAARLLRAARAVQEAVAGQPGGSTAAGGPGGVVVATGLSWYRQYGAGIAAGLVSENWCQMAGFGRQAFAYPDFAADILRTGGLVAERCCVTCGNCTVIMRDGGRAGCMVRDREVYLPIYRQGREGKPAIVMGPVAEHL